MTLKLLLKKGKKVEHLLVWGESLLVIQQAIRNFEVKKAHLVVCKAKVDVGVEELQGDYV